MISTEITPARIGRSMNSFENPMGRRSSAAGLCLDAPGGRSDSGAWPHALHAVDHDPIVALQAVAHNAQATLEIAWLHDALLRDVVLVQRPDESPRLVTQDCAVGNEQRIELPGAEELQ